MAGTRLLIQSTFVVEFILLALTAIYFGLYKTKDPLSFHLPIYQRGRTVILQALQDLDRDQTQLPVPTLTIATTKEDAGRLENLLDGHGLSFQVIAAEDMSACQNLEVAKDDYYSIWVCPPNSKPEDISTPKVIRNGITFVFPNTVDTVENLFQEVFNMASNVPTQRKPLKFSLMMEPRDDWNDFAQSFSRWVQQEEESLYSWQPCLRGDIQSQVVLSTLSGNQAVNKQQGRRILTTNMKKSVIDRHAVSDAWNAIFYVPKATPAKFVDPNGDSSGAMFVDNTFVSTIEQPEHVTKEERVTGTDEHGNETTTIKTIEIPVTIDDLVKQAMAPLQQFLLHQCLGLNASDSNQQNSDGSLPLWYLQAWFQRALDVNFQKVRSEIKLEGEWLLQSTTWVVIDEQVAAHWQTLLEWLEQAKHMAGKAGQGYDHFLEALEILEESLEYLEALRTDPTLMEPLRFSLPQFMAIFAPLCLPLFLPPLIGLIREYKRYKKLKAGEPYDS